MKAFWLLSVFYLFVPGALLWSQANPLDLSFGINGVSTEYATAVNSNTGTSLAIQPDGSILITGLTIDSPNADFFTIRLTEGGLLDTSFNGTGKTYTDFANTNDFPTDVALQTDGKILVGGCAFAGPLGDFALTRYLSNGQYDTSFGTYGKVKMPVGLNDDRAFATVVQPDGKILMAGTAIENGLTGFALVRYQPDGSLDTSFDNDGKVITTLQTNVKNVQAMVIQPDGKILVAGDMDHLVVIRYNADGSLDYTFGSSGIVTTTVGNYYVVAYDMALQTDGKILVTGATADPNFALVRYNPDGSLDSGFGNAGKVITSVSTGDDIAYAISLQPDGQILVGGTANNRFALVKYNTNGSLDETFGNGGIVTTQIGYSAQVYGLDFQPDGKIIAGGYAYLGTPVNLYYALARYISNLEVGVIDFS
ncbi:MAG: delta-60 repeat domain-containing protein, partial [Saprospiraceae bacterium]